MARSYVRLILIGLLGLAVVVAGGLLIAGVANNSPVGPDGAWHDFLAGHRSTVADGLALALNAVGGVLGMTIVTTLVVLFLLLRRDWRPAASIAVTVALAVLASNCVKAIIDRPRPADEILSLGADSFPSGHVTAAAAFVVALAVAFPRLWTRVFAVAWIPLMAWSRNYLLVHWLTDVVAGAVLGCSIALLVAGAQSAIGRAALPIVHRRALARHAP